MRNHLVALLLLLVFGGGLFSGAHACQFPGAASESDEAKPDCHSSGAATASTHHGYGTAAPSECEDDGCSDEKGGCKHACHMVALVRVQIAVFAVQPQARMVTPTFDRSLPLFAPPIDHIPLA
ncbi:MAG TPA: hypothetical protein VJ885_05995 [Thermoanaerobaculia bacterium]|nr:hypothetical protein [Thermoanaerobaculia bacterium]